MSLLFVSWGAVELSRTERVADSLKHMLEYISDLLMPAAKIPGRSTLHASSCGNLVVPQTCRQIGDRALSVAAPRAWNRLPTELKLQCCDQRTCFVVIWKDFRLILFMGTRIWIGYVMCPRSSSRGHNTSASVTVRMSDYTHRAAEWVSTRLAWQRFDQTGQRCSVTQ